MTNKLNPAELQAKLDQFTGTTRYYRTGYITSTTDGARYLAKHAGAYWLLNIIDSVAPFDDFAVVDLTVDLVAESGHVLIHNGHDPEDPELYRVFHEQTLEYTDFPFANMKLYVQNSIILLPSEY